MGSSHLARFVLAIGLALLVAGGARAQGSLYEELGAAYGQIARDARAAAERLRGLVARYDADGVDDPFLLSDIYLALVLAHHAAGEESAALARLDEAGARQPMLTKRIPEMAYLRGEILAGFGLFAQAGASYGNAADYMALGGWSERFDAATRARVQLLGLHAEARAAWVADEGARVAEAEALLPALAPVIGQPGGAVLPLLPLRMKEYRGEVLAAREGYLAQAEGSELRAGLLALAALADWRLGRRDLARKEAEAALADGGLGPKRAALMEAVMLLTAEGVPDMAAMAPLVARFAPEPGADYVHADMVDLLELMTMLVQVVAAAPEGERPEVAALEIPAPLLDFDTMSQDGYGRRLIAALRLDLARMLEAEGKAEAAEVHYSAVRLQVDATLGELAVALAGLSRVGGERPEILTSFAYAAAQVARGQVEAVPSRMSSEARRQQEAYAALFEGGVDAIYDRMEADPPMGPMGAAHVTDFVQSGPYVFPWREADGYVPLEAGRFWVDRLEEAFGMMQSARQSAAGRAIEAMTARLAAGGGEVGRLLRARDAALVRRDALVARGPAGQAEVAAVDAELDRIEAALAEAAPEWQAAAAPQPLGLEEARDLLGEGEALLVQLQTVRGFHVFIVTPDVVVWQRSDLSEGEIGEGVRRLRRALDPSGPQRAAVALKAAEQAPEVFDRALAERLHGAALGAAVGFVPEETVIFAVPDGAFQALPLGVLLASPAGEEDRWDEMDWAIRHHAFATLPLPASLRALRDGAGASTGELAFLGLADPAFGAAQAGLSLPRLPETVGEVEALNGAVAGGAGRLVTGAAVQEAALGAEIPLGAARVVAFATHGLLGGEAAGLTEPALALAAPEGGGDGLLSASEIALLELDADWVLLSACNTALGPGGEGAEGLSGLARAFLYAGARRLLVSHWAVDSLATVELTTGMFDAMAEAEPGPAAGARALRAAMLGMIENPARPRYAHPAAWAPFVTVGG
ncbi:CHAT domain-containing protein [Vannielia litorea]|uniref:CHAT domain-containing protein n=1 Tax=Vannielia litorea TaxID=1217970 RepID=UPI001C9849A2|nr:CHAT domain-containing protein [Vannielia litorea]MBY6152522.1 CHAT domain-containing protein [Vannielia litorea]